MSMPRSPLEVEGSRGCECPLPRKLVEGDIGFEVRAGRKGLACPRVPVGKEQVAEHPSPEGGMRRGGAARQTRELKLQAPRTCAFVHQALLTKHRFRHTIN